MANRQPYVIFTCAVALATLLGGAGPGLLALILGCLSGSILSENPILPLKLLPTSAGDFANLFAFIFPGSLIWGSVIWLRRAAERGQAQAAALAEANRRLEVLYSVTEMFAGATTLAGAAPAMLKRFCEATGSDVASLWVVTPGSDELRCLASVPCSDSLADQFRPFIARTQSTQLRRGVGLPGEVWQTRGAVWKTQLSENDNFIRATDARESGLRSGFALPILVGTEVLGVVEMFSEKVTPQNKGLLELLSDICARIGHFAARAAALEEKSQRLSASLIVGRAGTFRWNVRTNEVDADLPLINLFGLSPGSKPVPVSAFRDVVHPDDLEVFDQTLLKTTQDGVDFNLEYRIVWPDKSIRWISARSSIVRDGPGAGNFAMGACVDITERRKLELQLQDQRDVLTSVINGADLTQILDRLTQVVESRAEFPSIATIHLLDSSGEYLYPVAVRSAPTGWTALISQLRIGPDVGSCGSAAYAKKPVLIENTQTDPRYSPLRREAAQFNLAASWSVPILSAENKTLGTFAVYCSTPRLPTAQEVHYVEILAKTAAIAIERRAAESKLAAAHMHLEEQVHERTASLRAALAEREAFCYSLSHDLRAPLRAMHGYAEAVVEDFSDTLPAAARDHVEKIRRASNRMDKLIQDVLAVAAISEIKPICSPLDLQTLIPDVVAQFPDLAGRVSFTGSFPKVHAHEGLLTQALCKILDNTLKFASPDRPLQVDISAGRLDENIRVSIRDNGIGVSEKYSHRLFQLFGRIHPDSKFDGPGIGLVIAKAAIENMHGTIGFFSEWNEGCTFWFELPASE